MDDGVAMVLKLLVVEGDPGALRMLQELLGDVPDWRFDIRGAGSVAEGLRALESDPPDVVLLDLGLPDAQWLQGLQAMTPRLGPIPVVVQTGCADPELASEALRQGAEDFVVKGEFNGPLLARVLQHAVERKRVRRLNQRQQERYRTLVEAMSTVVLSLDAQRQLVTPQPAWEQFTGQSFAEAKGTGWLDAVDADDRAPLESRWAQAEAEGTLLQAEVLVHHGPSGEPRRCELRGVLQPGADDAGREWMLALTDIHDRYLEGLERERLERQLQHAQRLESVGRLAGGMAHDFNNLLTIIQGNAYLMTAAVLADGSLTEELQGIQEATRKASSLTRQLLAFSRRQVLQPEVLDLNSVVEELQKMLRRLIGEDVALHGQYAEKLWPVKADPGQIEQVLLNLAVNARDAMPEGGTLTIETANVEVGEGFSRTHLMGKPGPHVMLAVSDTGIGMDEDTQAQIFDPFFTTKDKGKGTGLGLSMVYGIVKQSDGHIFVQSQPGEGTTFKIYLPKVKTGSKSSQRIPRPATARLTGTETVLLVEDEPEVRRLVARILESYGYQVIAASSGEEALARFQEQPDAIDLLLTDIVMPDIYGPKVAARLRELRPKLPVLFTSGYTDNAVVLQGVLNEGLPYIQKPFTPTALVTRVREILDDQSTSCVA